MVNEWLTCSVNCSRNLAHIFHQSFRDFPRTVQTSCDYLFLTAFELIRNFLGFRDRVPIIGSRHPWREVLPWLRWLPKESHFVVRDVNWLTSPGPPPGYHLGVTSPLLNSGPPGIPGGPIFLAIRLHNFVTIAAGQTDLPVGNIVAMSTVTLQK
jgi:hypothetical protein